jgi:hypothetical protein
MDAPFDVMQLNRDTIDDLRALRGIPQRIADILLALRRERQRIAGDRMLSAEGMAAQRQQATQRAETALQALADEAASAERRIRQAVAAVTAKVLDPQAALLRELQVQRAWNRFRAMLEAGADPLAAVERASGDLVAIQALREELPAYLEARGATELIVAAQEVLDRLERPLLPPVARRARDILAEVDAGMAQLRMAFAHAGAEVAGDWDVTAVIPAWERGSVLQVSEPAMA